VPDPMHMLHLDRRYLFRADVEEVWHNMGRVEEFPDWWRWLRDFDIQGSGLETGGVLSGLVVPPIPYRFRVSIHMEDVQPNRSIRASLSGDLTGPAAVDLRQTTAGCELTIRWDVEMQKPSMRSASRFCRPLLVWGHDQVIEITLRRFEAVVGETIA
jgi:hypothetical protein